MRDIEIIDTELMLADLEAATKALDRAGKNAKTGDKKAVAYRDLLQRVTEHLGAGQPVRTLSATPEEFAALRDLHFLTVKPVMYVANVDEAGIAGNAYVERVRAHAQAEGAVVVVVCAAIEAEIAELDGDDKIAFLDDLGLSEPGLDRVIRAGYELLGLQTYFTAGKKEVRAWTVRKGYTAPQAAGVIHTDFEKGFIRAEVTHFADYVACNGEQGAKEAGKLRLEGKDYVVEEGDVMHFRFNV